MMFLKGGGMMDATYTGERISSRRKERGMTQQELAELLHVTNKAVSKWECGKNFPDLPLLQPLAEILGTTVAGLLGVEQPITDDTIAVLTAISQQEKKAIKRSLYQFIIMAMLSSTLFLIFRYQVAEGAERYLYVLNIILLVNGGTVLGYLHRKFSDQRNFRWPDSQDDVLMRNLKISVSMWMDRFRRK